NVPQHLQPVSAVQPRDVAQLRVGGTQRVGQSVPAHRQVSHYVSQNDNPGALVKPGQSGAVEHGDEPNSQQNARHQEQKPQQGSDTPAPGQPGQHQAESRRSTGKPK